MVWELCKIYVLLLTAPDVHRKFPVEQSLAQTQIAACPMMLFTVPWETRELCCRHNEGIGPICVFRVCAPGTRFCLVFKINNEFKINNFIFARLDLLFQAVFHNLWSVKWLNRIVIVWKKSFVFRGFFWLTWRQNFVEYLTKVSFPEFGVLFFFFLTFKYLPLNINTLKYRWINILLNTLRYLYP